MTELWGTLFPLVVGSAVVPLQILVTLLLLRTAGRSAAASFVGGMTLVRLSQGVMFGLVLSVGAAATVAERNNQSDGATSLLYLVIAGACLATAIHRIVDRRQREQLPRWLAVAESVTPWRAFLLGVVLIAVGVRFWVFTLGAIGAIADAQLGPLATAATFGLFVLLAESIHLSILAVAFAAPARSDAVLGRVVDWLGRYDSAVVITVGLALGAVFLIRSLRGFSIF